MTMKEIGSEFWEKYEVDTKRKTNNVEYLLSGRIALDFILKDIGTNRKIHTAMLPSYCCDSMIVPFVKNGIDVIFYNVDSNGIHYPKESSCDVVLLLDYFGYENHETKNIAKSEYESGKIIIYDSTHKLNGNPSLERWAHYSFCSYRKWFYCNYAKVIKHNGFFNNKSQMGKFESYIKLRDKAAMLKCRYMLDEIQDKTDFLTDFADAEKMIESNYENLAGIPVDFPIHDVIKKRQENARYLINRLLRCPEIKLLNSSVKEDDAPLFVPILVSAKKRENLRKYLIEKNIYCPIHWPKTSLQIMHSDLYDKEISLICDQRYTVSDMDYIADEIEKFFCM